MPQIKDHNKSTLLVFMKEMFRGFKVKSKAETDPQCELAHTTNQCNTQWSNHHKEKAGNLLAGDVIEQYKVQHDGTDPSPFIIPDHMSNEASGPEDEVEIYDDWKQRMATAVGFAAETPISHLKFLEDIMQQSRIFNNLHDIWWMTKSSKECEKFAIQVRGSGQCSTNADILKVSPYDVGINLRWLNEAQKDHLLEEWLKDWGKYGGLIHIEESGAAASEEGDADAEGDEMTTGGGGEHETDGVGGAEDHIPVAFLIFTVQKEAKAVHADYDQKILEDVLDKWKAAMGLNDAGEPFNIAVRNMDNDIRECYALTKHWPSIHLILCLFHTWQSWRNGLNRYLKPAPKEPARQEIQAHLGQLLM
ncbi:hypothetical protein EDB19DRAFT_1904837 [Suillus lakei]|nr:hypothetical protein EDB19DRAFT_1904837 [Suillus lakei]